MEKMQQATSSPEFRHDPERPRFRRGKDTRVSTSISGGLSSANDNRGFSRGNARGGATSTTEWTQILDDHFTEAAPQNTTDVDYEYSTEARYASLYKAFDFNDYIQAKTEMTGFKFTDLKEFDKFMQSESYSETGETIYDVKYSEDRCVISPPHLILHPLNPGGRRGLRGHLFIRNKTSLNVTFFVKPSSPRIHVKKAVDWILPKENYKLHFKTHAPYNEIAKEFILIFAAPLYFRQQLHLPKLIDFWKGLGSKFNPISHVDCYRTTKILLGSEAAEENFTMLDRLSWASYFFYREVRLVQTPPAIDITYSADMNYSQFWGLEAEHKHVLAIATRELKRAARREVPEQTSNFRNVILTGIGLLGSTALIFAWWSGMILLDELKASYPPWLQLFLENSQESLPNSITQFQEDSTPLSPAVSLHQQEEERSWKSCFNFHVPDNPRWDAYLISRCLLTKTVNLFSS